MGLTLHFGIKTNTRSTLKVLKYLEVLRQHALDRPFTEVGDEVVEVEEKDFLLVDHAAFADFYKDPRNRYCFKCRDSGKVTSAGRDPENDIAISAALQKLDNTCPKHHKHTWQGDAKREAAISASRYFNIPETRSYIAVYPTWAAAFDCNVAPGSEWLTIGLAKYPAIIEHDGKRLKTKMATGFQWEGFCKTHYAVNHGLANFLRAHLLVCDMMDAAKNIGLEVDVQDEGEYYNDPKRDVDRLAKEIGGQAAMVSAFAGALKDAVGGEMSVVSPAFNHPNYEKLEASGCSQENTQKILALLTKGVRIPMSEG